MGPSREGLAPTVSCSGRGGARQVLVSGDELQGPGSVARCPRGPLPERSRFVVTCFPSERIGQYPTSAGAAQISCGRRL